jgi:hypothetical protein
MEETEAPTTITLWTAVSLALDYWEKEMYFSSKLGPPLEVLAM